jgi:ureidoglycolate hydrolase
MCVECVEGPQAHFIFHSRGKSRSIRFKLMLMLPKRHPFGLTTFVPLGIRLSPQGASGPLGRNKNENQKSN